MAPDSDEPALFADVAQPAASAPYRVLARKYRPQSFDQLIGQDGMVQTLGNAILRDRIAHAFLLTGVRGVGKTSTARLIAKALNCVGPDGQGGPTISPCGACEPCVAVAEGRHIDVVEIDAASNNGIDDIREISEAVRYAAVSARYKVYIIDEVHMLSKPAFNAVLKTLEEPPPHVKFILATTEIAKVPVTVLSRCQRFDLRRIPADRLASHFADIARIEGVEASGEALALIARAAEGSVRDGLSILDQAIAHGGGGRGGGSVDAAAVRDMLGLADRGSVRALLAKVLAGDGPGALAALGEHYALGVEPASLFRELLAAVHAITRAKAGGPDDPAQSAEERAANSEWAGRLGHGTLHRLWQLLLKGFEEINSAPSPLETAEMALLRTVFAADLPDPGATMATLSASQPAPAATPAAPPSPGGPPPDFAALVDLLNIKGRAHVAQQLHDYVALVRYAPPELVIRPLKVFPGDFAREVAAALGAATGTQWRVSLSDDEGAPSLLADEQQGEAAARDAVLASPVVKAALDAFPDAELVGYAPAEQQKA